MEKVRELAAGIQVIKECAKSSSKSASTSKVNKHQDPPQAERDMQQYQHQKRPSFNMSSEDSNTDVSQQKQSHMGFVKESMPSNQDKQGRKRPRDGGQDGDMYTLRHFSDSLKKALEKTDVVLTQPYNILNNAVSFLKKRLDIEQVENMVSVRAGRAMKQKRNNWVVNIYLDDIKLITFQAPNQMVKTESKTKAGEALINLLLNPRNLTINSQQGCSPHGRQFSKEVVSVGLSYLNDVHEDYKTWFQAKKHKSSSILSAAGRGGLLENFVILEVASHIPDEVRDIQILYNSAQANHVTLEVVNSDTKVPMNGEQVWVCKCYINGELLGEGHDEDQKKAKHNAGKKAMVYLRQHCPTVKYKRDYETDQRSAIPVQDIMQGGAASQLGGSSSKKEIEENNIGHKMLKMMGWKGEGGLGKEGSGISQPIIPIEHIRGAGLGFSDNGLNKDVVKRLMEDYISSGQTDPLVFSASLTNDERKEIHNLARRFNLKSKSHGKGEDRYLLITNKRSLQQMVMDAATSGGSTSTSGYDVCLPGVNTT